MNIKKIKAGIALLAICGLFASGTVKDVQVQTGKVWWGIGELVSKKGAGFKTRAAVGAIGIADAAAWGFAVGMVGTPVGGMIAGAIAGA